MSIQTYDSAVFNSQLSLGEATRRLESANKARTLGELRKVIQTHGLEKVVGLSLLHNHFLLAKDEILCEKATDKFSSETCPISTKEARKLHTIPQIFRAVRETKGGETVFAPLEFTTNKDAIPLLKQVTSNKEFLTAFGAKVLKLGLENVIGLGLVDTSSPGQPEGYTSIEFTEEKARLMKTVLKSPKDVQKLASSSLFEAWWSAVPACGSALTRRCYAQRNGDHFEHWW